MTTQPAPVPAAVLFDMDGLLVDSEPVWSVAEHELFASWGREFTDELKQQIMGTRLDVAVPILLAAAGRADDPQVVQAWLLHRMTELFAAGLVVQPGAHELYGACCAAGVATALVSSSYRVLVDAVVGQLRWRFDVTVAGDEVAVGKPHPEPYLRAAALLGLSPRDCVVLEDSRAGAESGLAAGCHVVVVPSSTDAATDPRWRTVASLAELDLAALVS